LQTIGDAVYAEALTDDAKMNNERSGANQLNVDDAGLQPTTKR